MYETILHPAIQCICCRQTLQLLALSITALNQDSVGSTQTPDVLQFRHCRSLQSSLGCSCASAETVRYWTCRYYWHFSPRVSVNDFPTLYFAVLRYMLCQIHVSNPSMNIAFKTYTSWTCGTTIILSKVRQGVVRASCCSAVQSTTMLFSTSAVTSLVAYVPSRWFTTWLYAINTLSLVFFGQLRFQRRFGRPCFCSRPVHKVWYKQNFCTLINGIVIECYFKFYWNAND